MRWSFVVALVLVALLSSVATVGAERMITGADIKDGSITGRDIKPGSIDVKRIEPKGRHTVYRSRRPKRRGRNWSQVLLYGPSPVNLASVTVPAGDYVITGTTAMFATTAGPGVQVDCYFTDSANVLNENAYDNAFAPGVGNETVPLSVTGTATYTQPTQIFLTCTGTTAVAFYAFDAALIAEQVAFAN